MSVSEPTTRRDDQDTIAAATELTATEVGCYVRDLAHGMRQITQRVDQQEIRFLDYLLAIWRKRRARSPSIPITRTSAAVAGARRAGALRLGRAVLEASVAHLFLERLQHQRVERRIVRRIGVCRTHRILSTTGRTASPPPRPVPARRWR